MGDHASAFPSKRFFVEMLTRDIELGDAILDLIDNCIDGIHRELAKGPRNAAASAQPYKGFWARIDLDKKSFAILDNCGGIPRDVAEKHAFRLGRPEGTKEVDAPTVGVYGIGMKRSLFKLGRSATVTTLNAGKAYRVSISKQWMKDDNDWSLPLADIPKANVPVALGNAKAGTLIEVEALVPGVVEEFDTQGSTFLTTLRSTVATHYSYILHKGFAIEINKQAVAPRALNILVSRSKAPGPRIEPFVYESEHDGIKVELIVGLYRSIPSEKEVQDELTGKATAGSRETCGWTVICNDRVVVYNDKTRLTGWSEAGVPAYHPQFNAIAGIVRFQSNQMVGLPITTTKRGLDASSELYLAVKDQMREGLKTFTNFTNHWKEHGADRDALVAAADSSEPFSAAAQLPKTRWSAVHKGLRGRKYVPDLPRPKAQTPTDVTIKFTRRRVDVERVAAHLFEEPETVTATQVGEECFDRYLSQAKQ